MKNFLQFSLFLSLMFFSQYLKAQGLENFNNYGETTNVYNDSIFLGQDGSTWHYFQCRGDSVITAPTPTLGKGRIPTAEIISGSISGGCSILSFQYKQVFTSNVSLDVFINGLLFKTVTSSSEQGIIKNSGNIMVNLSGTIVIDLKQSSTTSGQVAVDNLTWTGYSGGPLPEPTSYPTTFTATPGTYNITLTWNDATNGQAPIAYLIKASNVDAIANPVDGIPVQDDLNLADGDASVNIFQGVQTCTFSGLPANVPYYFKISPYTNTGTLINFKTDGTVPSASATTPNLSSILSQNWDTDATFGDWTTYSVTGDQVWVIDTDPSHSYSPPDCAKMSGYSTGYFENEDWLISPPMNFDLYTNEILSFMSAFSFSGPPIEVKISTNYDGISNPNSATWTNLSATLSSGGFVFLSSGDIDVSAFSGTNVRIGFKYTSTNTDAPTWELDDILVIGEFPVGIHEKTNDYFNIYPNPSNGMVNLKFNNTEKKQIGVYSILGNSVYSGTSNHSTALINLSDLDKGIYFLRISDQNGSNPVTKKLILQ